MSLEQEFYHHKFMQKAKQVSDKDELLEILDLVHANYVIKSKLFSKLALTVTVNGFELPPLSELLRD